MLSEVAHFLRLRIGRLFRFSERVNPVYTATLLIFQFSLALVTSLVVPLVVRRLALPSSIENEIDLNLSFSTCRSDLHGVCSFPSAAVEYEKGTLFSPTVEYSLSIRLRFVDNDQGRRLGFFQNVLSFHNENQQLKTYTKTSYLREPSLFTKALWVFFFPLYFTGFFHDYNSLDILMTSSHIETLTHPSTKLFYELQDRFAQVDSASLVIGAQFGIIRYLLYNWPITTSLILFLGSFSVCFSSIICYWGVKSFLGDSETHNAETAFSLLPRSFSKDVGLNGKSTMIRPKVPHDEYIPDNVDEVPSSVNFSEVPGWEVLPSQNNFDDVTNSNIRRRK
ncbi:hypothetical protein RB195_013876 [Necator americanus]|uniref:Seipin n=1 Tax=Necator americanus TaxID=51031 RepID=A0ABR1DXI5_NECAM